MTINQPKPKLPKWGTIHEPNVQHAIAVLTFAAEVGTDPSALANATKLPLHIVEQITGRLREAGYWAEDAILDSPFLADGDVDPRKLMWQAYKAIGKESPFPAPSSEPKPGDQAETQA